MSLADVYKSRFADGASEKTASDSEEEQKIAAALDQFTEEDCAKLAAASDMLDAYGMEYDNGLDKLSAAGQVVDYLSQEVDDEAGEGEKEKTEEASDEDSEKTASEFEAAGRLMARAFHDESSKLASGGGAAPDTFASRIAASLGK